MSTENLEHEDQNKTTEPIIDILGNEAPADPEQEIVSQGVHNYSAAETYVRPTDPAILQQLEWFQDQKLALMMHFGLYCQPGMVASWALSDKDSDWSRHQVNWADGETFKKQYFNLNRSFNPVRFQPEGTDGRGLRVPLSDSDHKASRRILPLGHQIYRL